MIVLFFLLGLCFAVGSNVVCNVDLGESFQRAKVKRICGSVLIDTELVGDNVIVIDGNLTSRNSIGGTYWLRSGGSLVFEAPGPRGAVRVFRQRAATLVGGASDSVTVIECDEQLPIEALDSLPCAADSPLVCGKLFDARVFASAHAVAVCAETRVAAAGNNKLYIVDGELIVSGEGIQNVFWVRARGKLIVGHGGGHNNIVIAQSADQVLLKSKSAEQSHAPLVCADASVPIDANVPCATSDERLICDGLMFPQTVAPQNVRHVCAAMRVTLAHSDGAGGVLFVVVDGELLVDSGTNANEIVVLWVRSGGTVLWNDGVSANGFNFVVQDGGNIVGESAAAAKRINCNDNLPIELNSIECENGIEISKKTNSKKTEITTTTTTTTIAPIIVHDAKTSFQNRLQFSMSLLTIVVVGSQSRL